MGQDTNSELIKIVYTVAAEPYKLHLMQGIIDEKLQEIYEKSGTDCQLHNPDLIFQDIEIHFQHAMELLERKGRTGQKNSVAINIINSDPKPAALIYPNGIVMHANSAVSEACGFKEGHRVPSDIFTPQTGKDFFKALKNVSRLTEQKLLGVYKCRQNDGKNLKLTLAKAEDVEGRAIGRISCVSLSWDENVGRQFMESFGLTPIEKEITRTVILGESLSGLAKARNRSVGTVRNQLKKLLSKLDLHSKAELMSLYSSFLQITHMPYNYGGEQPFFEDDERLHFKMERANGKNLSYEIFGAHNKYPVLYLHPIVGGTGLLETMQDEANKHSLRLIMPWRPNFYDTEDDGPLETITERFAQDMERLLDHLDVEKCVVLAGNEASVSYTHLTLPTTPYV